MGDFHQSGQVTTLHQFNQRSLEDLENELNQIKTRSPMALVLPSLFSELERPALSRIVDELSEVSYLDQIVVGLDQADESQYIHALEYFSRLPQQPMVVWNDGPRMKRIDALLRSHKLAPEEPGKGRNVWYMFGLVLASNKAQSVALHDCDITTYDRSLLARLLYPVAQPQFSFKFCKGYYARVAQQHMNGRVCRLLVTPLLRALQKVCGPNEYLQFMDSFRYPLAGEFSLRRDVIEDLRIPSDWGLEMGVLSELQRNYAPGQICQVDIADSYDHKHQDLSAEDRTRGLSKMSCDIAKSLYRKMATQGEVFSPERIRTIKATYYRIALDMVERYYCDARMNGLEFDRHKEGQAVEIFAENIMSAGHAFLEKAMDTPFMPSWKRVVAAVPDIYEQLLEAVSLDTQDFSPERVSGPSQSPSLTRLKHRIDQHVKAIYGADVSDGITRKVVEACRFPEGPLQAPSESLWSEKDAVLITYGDSILRTGEAPLKTLHRFMRKELRNRISGVHVLPFCPFTSDDGFSVVDYQQVNPDLGTWSDLEALGQEFSLMADLVLNHCSAESEWFKQFKQGKRPGRDYFISADPEEDYSAVVRPRSHPLLEPVQTAEGEKYVWCTFSADQVDLNFANPEVFIEFIHIIRHYLKKGVRYFRLDAVAYLWKESGTGCVHLPQTHELVKLLRLVLEHLEPKAVVVTETNVPNRENLSYFGNDNEAHLIYNFSLPPLLLHALLTGTAKHLVSWMMSMPPARMGRSYFNFLASHDGIGVRPLEGLLGQEEQDQFLNALRSFGGHVSMRRMPDGTEKPYEVNISFFDAVKGTVQDGPDPWQFERFVCAHTLMLALEGIPGLYIHSLLGTPNDEALVTETGRARSINRHRWDSTELDRNLEDPESMPHRVLQELKHRLAIRRNQPAFHPNATQYTLHLGDAVFGFWRESLDRRQNIFALHNLTAAPQAIPLVELNLVATVNWQELLTGKPLDDLQGALELPPYGCAWIAPVG